MKNYYITKIKSYNSTISYFNLITRKIKRKRIIILFTVLLFLFISIALFILKNTLWGGIFLSASLIFVILYLLKIRSEEKKIIKKYYPYSVNADGSLKPNFILEIQKRELAKLLGNDLIKKDSLVFLMEKLSNHQQNYSYGISIGIISIVIAILSGPFLGRFLDFATDMTDFLSASKILIPIGIFYSVVFIVIDIFMIRKFVLQHVQNKSRIVRTIENIYLEKIANDSQK